MVSDENDVCFSPKREGYTEFPHFVPSWNNVEDIAFKRYCEKFWDSGSSPWDKASQVLNATREGHKTSVGGIVYLESSSVPKQTEESIGHGVIEFAEKNQDNILIDLGAPSYSPGLEKMGSLVSNQLNLLTQFKLDGNSEIAADSIKVSVDGKVVSYVYNTNQRDVSIGALDAGKAKSVVDVSACKVSIE